MTLGETLILVWQQSLADGQEKVDQGSQIINRGIRFPLG